MKKTSDHLTLSIVSPVHNEQETVESFVRNAVLFLRQNKIPGEVVIIENGSKDQTCAILVDLSKKYKELVVKSLLVGNKGLALKTGLKAARGELVVTLDTDLWDENFVKKSIAKLSQFDIVVGSKNISGAKDSRPLLSRLLNRGYNFLFKLFFNFSGTETHAKLSFRRSAILPLVLKCQTADLVFDTELILRAEKASLSKIEIPTSVSEIRPRRYSLLSQLLKTAQNFLLLIRVLGISPHFPYVILFGSFVLASFLRFYNFQNWFFFSADEELNSFMTRMITVNHHFPLIGLPISGTSLYMAPWFIYFNAVWFWLSNNSPVIAGMVFTFLELFVIWFIYSLSKKVASPLAASLASLLYASSFLLALFDRHYWNITLVPIISVSAFYCLFLWTQERKPRWVVLAGLIVGFGMSTTFSIFALFIFSLLILFFFRRPFFKRELFIFLGIIIAFHVPLILFDLRHQFWLTKAFFGLFLGYGGGGTSLIEGLKNISLLFSQTISKAIVMANSLDVSSESSICTVGAIHYQPGSVAVWLTSLVFIVSLFVLKNSRKMLVLVLLLLATNFGSLALFRADAGERHFLPFLPLLFILLAAFISWVERALPKGKLLAITAVGLLVLVNIFSFIHSFASFGLSDKLNAVAWISSQTRPGSFYLDAKGYCQRFGFRYLFSWQEFEPAASYLDPDFAWTYPKAPNTESIRNTATVIVSTPTDPNFGKVQQEANSLRAQSAQSARFGNIEVFWQVR